jgi:hypothetical protein
MTSGILGTYQFISSAFSVKDREKNHFLNELFKNIHLTKNESVEEEELFKLSQKCHSF